MKKIFLTMTATASVLMFVGTLFLNTVLGAFGLVTASAKELSQLRESQQIVEKMKAEHKKKKVKTTKRFLKRTTRGVSGALASAVPYAALVVAGTFTVVEADEYCDEQKDLQDEYNILYKTEVQFGYQECLIQAKEESQKILTQVKDSASNSVRSVIDSTANYSAEKWEELKNSTNKALNSSNETTDKVFETFSYE